MSKYMTFCHLLESIWQYVTKLLHTARKTGLDALETASNKLVEKTTETAAELTGNYISE